MNIWFGHVYIYSSWLSSKFTVSWSITSATRILPWNGGFLMISACHACPSIVAWSIISQGLSGSYFLNQAGGIEIEWSSNVGLRSCGKDHRWAACTCVLRHATRAVVSRAARIRRESEGLRVTDDYQTLKACLRNKLRALTAWISDHDQYWYRSLHLLQTSEIQSYCIMYSS